MREKTQSRTTPTPGKGVVGLGFREGTGTDKRPPDKHDTGNVVQVWVNGTTGDLRPQSNVVSTTSTWRGHRKSRGHTIALRETGRYRVERDTNVGVGWFQVLSLVPLSGRRKPKGESGLRRLSKVGPHLRCYGDVGRWTERENMGRRDQSVEKFLSK